MLLASVLLLALTRAEIIDRFQAAPVTQLEGLVQVYGDCPADMRRDYQLPVAAFASDICRKLYQAENIRPIKFTDPGIVIRIGDVRTNDTNVVVRTAVRDDGARFTRIKLPSPGGADLERLRLEVVKAFSLAVKGDEIDDEGAKRLFNKADPMAHARDIAADITAWRERGVYTEGRTDEDYLRLMRSVHIPGVATPEDVRVFASRLYLYPATFDAPFCGKYSVCSFRDAVPLAKTDPRIRYAAYLKMSEIVAFGGGRGAKLTEASDAYGRFLMELTRYKLTEAELLKMLDDADAKLKGVLE